MKQRWPKGPEKTAKGFAISARHKSSKLSLTREKASHADRTKIRGISRVTPWLIR